MLPNVQRAKVESKSQHYKILCRYRIRCYQMYKELKLKANHNGTQGNYIIHHDVTKCTKS